MVTLRSRKTIEVSSNRGPTEDSSVTTRQSSRRSNTNRSKTTAAAAAAEAAPNAAHLAQPAIAPVTGALAEEVAGPPPIPEVMMDKPIFQYEFGGPVGAFGIIVGLPLVILGLYFFCTVSDNGTCIPIPWATLTAPHKLSAAVWSSFKMFARPSALISGAVAQVKSGWSFVSQQPLWSWKAFAWYMAWFVFQAALERLLPGEVEKGVKLADGSQLMYRINGHLAFWVSLTVVLGFPQLDRSTFPYRVTAFGLPIEKVYTHFPQLASSSIVFSLLLSLGLYAASFRHGALLAEGGKSGSPLYDFFIGRELNPRTGSFDWKYFCELRPGLIGWAVLNLGFLKYLYVEQRVILPLLLVVALQNLYVWDALFYEKAILTTMDITTDGFGFMLAFGDLAWVPFTYSLQARYLVAHDPGLSTPALVSISLLAVLGYWIFRGANSTKDAFRRDPALVPHVKYMDTARGRKLMTSGWWGLARKINYTGDWVMGLAWCLLCGGKHLAPYFYAIYFGVLLLHRAYRDDHMCALKYGDDWVRYKRVVPAVFIPKVW